jgi:TetR/AcrR family fatty acid metabolism transcriptional regulator
VFQTELRHSAKFLGQFSHNLMVEYFDLIKGVLKEGQAAGVFRADLSVTIAAHCFFGAVDEIVTSWILSDREHQLSSLADSVVSIVLKGVESGS